MSNLNKEVALSASNLAAEIARLAPWEQREKVSVNLMAVLKRFASSILDQARPGGFKGGRRAQIETLATVVVWPAARRVAGCFLRRREVQPMSLTALLFDLGRRPIARECDDCHEDQWRSKAKLIPTAFALRRGHRRIIRGLPPEHFGRVGHSAASAPPSTLAAI